MTDHRHAGDVFRSGPQECAYLRHRAAQHQQLAENSAEHATYLIHVRMMQLYCDRARLLELVLPDQQSAQKY